MRFIAEVFRFRSVGKLKRRNRRAAAHRIATMCGHLGGQRFLGSSGGVGTASAIGGESYDS